MSNIALGRTEIALLTNKSGGSVALGDVVVIDTANATAFTTTTTLGFYSGRIGVVIEPNGIASNAQGMIAFMGYIPQINLQASASIGDLIKTYSTAKQGTSHAAPSQVGDFAQALNTGTTPPAVLFGAMPPQLTGRLLIQEQTPSGVASVSFTSISAAFKKLILEGAIRSDLAATSFVSGLMTYNGDTTDANYCRTAGQIWTTVGAVSAADRKILMDEVPAATGLTNEFCVFRIEIPQYANTGFNKHALSHASYMRDNSSIYIVELLSTLRWNNTAAISQIDFGLSGGNFVSGSVLRLYGEN